MTLTFLDLYNSCASQEWSKYDNDAASNGDLEQSLVIDLNKAVMEILYSYPFPFREKTSLIITVPKINSYSIPKGIILKNKQGVYSVKINSHTLKRISDPISLDEKQGMPEGFYIKGSKLILYPTPAEKFILTVDYLSLVIGENADGDDIYSLSNIDDTISVPQHLEKIFKQTVIARTMLNAIASESDENYSAYKKQSEAAYLQLVKYAKGTEEEKVIKI